MIEFSSKERQSKSKWKNEKIKETKMSGLFDIQVKKQHNTWGTRKQWIRGTDGDLLGECYAIYQKWGLSNLAVGIAAMEHVFGLDPKKRSFAVHAAQKVEEVRKLLMKGEAESRAVVQSGERPTITMERVFARVKETQELASAQAVDKLQAYEVELEQGSDSCSARSRQNRATARVCDGGERNTQRSKGGAYERSRGIYRRELQGGDGGTHSERHQPRYDARRKQQEGKPLVV